jgi:hypothetical protein
MSEETKLLDIIASQQARIAELEAEAQTYRREASFFRAKFYAEEETSMELEAQRESARGELERMREALIPYCKILEARYDASDDGADYEAWQSVRALLEKGA